MDNIYLRECRSGKIDWNSWAKKVSGLVRGSEWVTEWNDLKEFETAGQLEREGTRSYVAHAVSYKLALSGLGEMKVHVLLLDCIEFPWIKYSVRLKHKEFQN